jgi:hypothetical protein
MRFSRDFNVFGQKKLVFVMENEETLYARGYSSPDDMFHLGVGQCKSCHFRSHYFGTYSQSAN